jgi:hypothetical protein
VFVSCETPLAIGFCAAVARLADLTRSGSLTGICEACYGEGITGLARPGLLGSAPRGSRLVTVHISGSALHKDGVVLPLRWQAVEHNGALFPALDADLTLTPSGEQLTMLRLDGAYRPPQGMSAGQRDDAMVHRVATATIRSFTGRVAHAIIHPPSTTGPAQEDVWPGPGTP